MGRTLTNTMINLGIQATCDEALYQVIINLLIATDKKNKLLIKTLKCIKAWFGSRRTAGD